MNQKIAQLKQLHESKKPHLRLFLSADIVGSTAFKQQPPKKRSADGASAYPQWFTVVLAFYQQAEQTFSKHWRSFQKFSTNDGNLSNLFGEAPELWKTVGDEVLFSKRIDHPTQVIVCLHAWIKTLEGLRKELKEYGNLDVKSTAWLADFPLRNNEVVLRQNIGVNEVQDLDDEYPYSNQISLEEYYDKDKKNLIRDFIGPSIDTGFRLGAFSSSRKLIVSVDLAFMLGTEQARADNNANAYEVGPFSLRRFVFKYDGRHALKGVLGGSPYPIIWLDLDPENRVFTAEDQVLNASRPSAAQIQEFAREFIYSHSPLLSIPYILSDEEMPKGYREIQEDELDQLIERNEYFLKGRMKRQAEQEVAPNSQDEVSLGTTEFVLDLGVEKK